MFAKWWLGFLESPPFMVSELLLLEFSAFGNDAGNEWSTVGTYRDVLDLSNDRHPFVDAAKDDVFAIEPIAFLESKIDSGRR